MSFLDRFRFKKKPFKEDVEVKKGVNVKKDIKQAVKREESGELKREIKNPSILSSPTLSGILVRPYLSEKSTAQSEKSKFVFEVKVDATKGQVSHAIRELYGVTPLKIAMIKMRGKIVRYGRTTGQTKNWKKAVITLPEGKKIDVYK